MTDRKITYALRKIKTSIQNGYILEGLIKSYHLNIDLVKYILSSVMPEDALKDKKIKALVHELQKAVNTNPELKSIINKKSVKSLKPWLAKMDVFFKTLKLQQPGNITALQQETEKIFGILKISANKLLIKQ